MLDSVNTLLYCKKNADLVDAIRGYASRLCASRQCAAGVLASPAPQQSVECSFCERQMIAGSECRTAYQSAVCKVRADVPPSDANDPLLQGMLANKRSIEEIKQDIAELRERIRNVDGAGVVEAPAPAQRRVLDVIHKWSDTTPEPDEDWESWFVAAFALMANEVADLWMTTTPKDGVKEDGRG